MLGGRSDSGEKTAGVKEWGKGPDRNLDQDNRPGSRSRLNFYLDSIILTDRRRYPFPVPRCPASARPLPRLVMQFKMISRLIFPPPLLPTHHQQSTPLPPLTAAKTPCPSLLFSLSHSLTHSLPLPLSLSLPLPPSFSLSLSLVFLFRPLSPRLAAVTVDSI